MSEQIRQTSRTVTDRDQIGDQTGGETGHQIDGAQVEWQRPVGGDVTQPMMRDGAPTPPPFVAPAGAPAMRQPMVDQAAFEQAPFEQRVVAQAPVGYASVDPASVDQMRTVDVTATRRRVSPASIMAGATSLALMVFGGVVVARAGIDTPLDLPIVEVFGYTATAILGLIVLGAGGMLLLAAFSRSRAAISFVSIVLGVGAAILAIEPSFGQASLATERDFAIAGLIVLGVTAAVALIAPDVDRFDQRRNEHIG